MCRHCGSEIKCLEKLRLADLALTNWHGPLVRRRKNRVPRTTNACRKSEIVLNSPDEQFCPPACLDRRSPIWRFEPPQGRKAPKKLLRVYPAQPMDKSRFGRENPRKSKEIQGNPTLKIRDFRSETTRAQENPNQRRSRL
jgi:hypothetical protein